MATISIRRRRLLRIGFALAFSATVFLLAAEPAQAFPSVGSMASEVIKAIFGIKGKWFTVAFVKWVIKVPEVDLTSGSGTAQVYALTQAMGFAMLGAVLTLAVIHYLCAGIAGQGGKSGAIGIDGAIRTGGAALMILAWPFLVENGVALSHVAANTLVPGQELANVTKAVFGLGAIGLGGGVPTIMVMLVMIAFSLVILVIFVTKLILGVGLVCIACGMPLALALWPAPPLAWLANGMAKWALGIAIIPIAWALEIDVYSHITMEAILFKGNGAWVEKLLQPLTVIALLSLMLSTAKSILRLSGVPATGGGGFLRTAAAMMASRFGMNALSRVIPDRFGGTRDTLAQRAADATYRDMHGAASDLASAQRARASAERSMASARAEMVDHENWMARNASILNQDPGPDPPPTAEPTPTDRPNGNGPAEPPQTELGHDGIPTRPGHRAAMQDNFEQMRQERRGTWHSPKTVAAAFDTLQSEGLDANAVTNYIKVHAGDDGKIMGRMADAQLALGLSPQAVNAFRTIGVADQDARAGGAGLWRSQQAAGNGNGSAPGPANPPKPASQAATSHRGDRRVWPPPGTKPAGAPRD